MADNTENNHMTNCAPLPSPSTPIHLSGFLTGDTVQVQGDTGKLQFSVQFNVRKKEQLFTEPFTVPSAPNPPLIDNVDDFVKSSSSSNFTPVSENVNEYQNVEKEQESELRFGVLTRLRSGVSSRVCYKVNAVSSDGFGRKLKKKRCRNAGERGRVNVLKDILKKRSSPLRPCNSYAFFLMANWSEAKAKSFTFEETSKELSKKWCKLPNRVKKEYETMASKDSARYKRQCLLLMNDIEQD